MTNILDLLKLKKWEKNEGVWMSGKYGEGEYKEWWGDGELRIHSHYKNGLLHGDYKWIGNGELKDHKLYKKGRISRDYLKK